MRNDDPEEYIPVMLEKTMRKDGLYDSGKELILGSVD